MNVNGRTGESYLKGIDKIKVGQKFSNYKELCIYLNQPMLSGNSKKSQIKEWKRCFDFFKYGQKIIVKQVYQDIKDKYDKRIFNGKSKYNHLIEDILSFYSKNFIESVPKEINITSPQILCICGMANIKYDRENIYQELLDRKISKFNIDDFFFRTKNKFNHIINCVLSGMKKKNILDFKKVIIVSNNNLHRLADGREEKSILNIENEVINSMGMKNISELILSRRYNVYNKKVRKIVSLLYDIDYVYRGYNIKFKNINNNCITDKEYLKLKSILNKRIIDFFDLQVRSRVRSYKNSSDSKFFLPNNYYLQQSTLSNLLLDINK